MRTRIICNGRKTFSTRYGFKTKNCNKVLFEVYADEAEEVVGDNGREIELVNAEKIIFKCNCRDKTVVKFKNAKE